MIQYDARHSFFFVLIRTGFNPPVSNEYEKYKPIKQILILDITKGRGELIKQSLNKCPQNTINTRTEVNSFNEAKVLRIHPRMEITRLIYQLLPHPCVPCLSLPS